MPITWWSQAAPAQRVAAVFGGLAALLACVLIATPKPWRVLLPAGHEMRVIDYVRIYSWWAAAANCVIAALIAASARWWASGGCEGFQLLPRPGVPRWFWPVVLAAMALSSWFGVQRLGFSFWDDEVYAMRRAIHGQWRRQADGTVKFRQVKWHETLWFFEKPQHVLHSAVSRIALDAWRAFAKPAGLKFQEAVVRTPSFVAGVLSVAAIALLLWRLEIPAAGAIAACLTAIHPWHIRYATELRGYSMMLLVLPLCGVVLIEALDTGKWRWWIAYAGALFVLMYANALNIYPAAGLGLCALAVIALRWRSAEARCQLSRFAVVTVIAGMLFLQLMLPCVPQFIEYLHTTAVVREMDLRWISGFLGLLFAGAPWSSTGEAVSPYVELYPWALRHPLVFTLVVATTLAFLVAGTWRLCSRGILPAMLILALLLPAPAAYLIARARHQHLFEWYLLFLLPGILTAVAAGMDSLRSLLHRRAGTEIPGILLTGCLVGGYALFTAPERGWLTTRPLQAIRESVEVTRPTLDPYARENQRILTASFLGPPDPYDANIILFRSVPELAALMAKADAESKSLYVNFGFIQTAYIRHPEILRLLADTTLFEETARLQGYEPINDRFVYHYKPGTLGGRQLVDEFK